MRPTVKYFLTCLAICLCLGIGANAQEKDSTKKKNGNILGFAVNAFKRTPDTSKTPAAINSKNETPYLPYSGKIIRKITIKQYGFDKVFTDTSKRIAYFGTRIINGLHHNTEAWVVRNNLYIKENTPLNPYVVADNERFLRSLEYMQDARILVNYLDDSPDSVDLVVVTKDLFSLSGDVGEISTGKFRGKISDANVMGTGQKIQLTPFIESTRTPSFAYEVLYSFNNIAHTFITGSAFYSRIRNNIASGSPDEHQWYLRLERPLVSQYKHMAGAITVGRVQAANDYRRPDSLFYNYRYTNFDAWLGYNLGVKDARLNADNKGRKFISLRYFNNNFTRTPYQLGNKLDMRFNNRQAVLGQFTFFKQQFYKSNYIFGFGTTEDIPYGYNISFTSGWYRQSYLNRLYLGTDANRYIVNRQGDIIQLFLRSEAFVRKGSFEDASVLGGISMFRRLIEYNSVKIRQYLRVSYTKQFNRLGLNPLQINNTFGIRSFNSDSARGDQRLSVHSETYMYLKYKLFGFKFAPFVFGDAAMLTPEKKGFTRSSLYYGLGGGVRTRNENFIFNTIEMRFVFFPRKEENNTSFKIDISTNINFRYNSNYVKSPDIIQLNNDPYNSLF
ncbi:hypothetical protein [Foetidibacter luteolus]|uniref:hypothetical protein n=1 Tax=Foetidibacter luteolus TaxID=2608880 RepID=UPI001F4301E2|nr:hypothetical protein [Foetidibacter luteolus]